MYGLDLLLGSFSGLALTAFLCRAGRKLVGDIP